MSQTNWIDMKKLESLADKIFQEHYVEVIHNDYSPICANIVIDRGFVWMDDLKRIEQSGFKITMVTNTKGKEYLVICVHELPRVSKDD